MAENKKEEYVCPSDLEGLGHVTSQASRKYMAMRRRWNLGMGQGEKYLFQH